MDRNKIISLIEATEKDVDFATQLSNAVIAEKTAELDALMREIQENVVNAEIYNIATLEHYLLQLTNARYFINTRIENFGFYEDITKANARLKYNEAYSDNQMNAVVQGKKTTNADNQLYAENNSIDENMLSIIYARSVKIVKGKIDSLDEMIRTLSKLISAQMNESSISRLSNKIS